MKSQAYEQMKKRFIDAAKTKRIPVQGHFELTARCNLDCKMCYVHTQDNAMALSKELSTEQWKRIFDEACACQMMYATLSGGECLVRRDFKELYLYLWNKKVMITVMTNGTLINEDYVDFFKTYPPDFIQISIYGSSEEGYLNVTGHRGFEKATTAAKALQDAGLDVRIAVTPSRYMTDDFIKTIRLCKEMGLSIALTDITLVANRENPEKDDYYLTIDETVALLKQRAELFEELKPVGETPEPFGCMCGPAPTGLTCNAGNTLAAVIWDGRMYPCANALIGDGVSLLEMSYAEAWEKTKEVADNVVRGVECEGCPYDDLCPRCPTLRLRDLRCGHCNTQICETTRKLVAAGVKKIK